MGGFTNGAGTTSGLRGEGNIPQGDSCFAGLGGHLGTYRGDGKPEPSPKRLENTPPSVILIGQALFIAWREESGSATLIHLEYWYLAGRKKGGKILVLEDKRPAKPEGSLKVFDADSIAAYQDQGFSFYRKVTREELSL